MKFDYSKLSESFEFIICSKDGQPNTIGDKAFDPATLDFSDYMKRSRLLHAGHDMKIPPIGMTESIWYDGENVRAKVRLLTDSVYSKPWLDGLRAGTVKGSSMGFNFEKQIPCLQELSLVGRGADKNALLQRKAHGIIYRSYSFNGVPTMNLEKLKKAFLKAVDSMGNVDTSDSSAVDKHLDETFDSMISNYDSSENDESQIEKARSAFSEVGIDAKGSTLEEVYRSGLGDVAKDEKTIDGLRVHSEYLIKQRVAGKNQTRSSNGNASARASFAAILDAKNKGK